MVNFPVWSVGTSVETEDDMKKVLKVVWETNCGLWFKVIG